jgi:hypothetical protein
MRIRHGPGAEYEPRPGDASSATTVHRLDRMISTSANRFAMATYLYDRC